MFKARTMNRIYDLYILILFIILSCSQSESTNESSGAIINLNEAFLNRYPIYINDISTSYEYVRLETKEECLTGVRLAVYSSDNYLLTVDRERMLLFNRNDGKFIRKIGHMGAGPGEFSRTYSVMPFNEVNNLIYARRNKVRYGYSFDGQLKDTLVIPELLMEIGDINDTLFAAFIPDLQGGEKYKLKIFNHNDSLIKAFPNYLSAPNTPAFFVWMPNSWYYRLNHQLYFFQLFNDTVFQIGINSIAPRFILDMGQYSPPYELKTSRDFQPANYFMMRTIQESSRYLFCSFNFSGKNYTAIYDKMKKTTSVNDYCPDAAGSVRGFLRNEYDFIPLEFSSINENDELICTLNAIKIKQWFDLNPEKVNQLPERLKALINVTETDNPVIVIAKLNKSQQ